MIGKSRVKLMEGKVDYIKKIEGHFRNKSNHENKLIVGKSMKYKNENR